MEEEKQIPYITRGEEGETFEIQIPECCRLFAEADPRDADYSKLEANCPHTNKRERAKKRNIGL